MDGGPAGRENMRRIAAAKAAMEARARAAAQAGPNSALARQHHQLLQMQSNVATNPPKPLAAVIVASNNNINTRPQDSCSTSSSSRLPSRAMSSSAAPVAASAAGAAAAPARESVRLPSTQRPSHYDVALIPDLQAFTFQGHVLITLELTAPLQSIVLNSADITYPIDKESGKPRVSIKQTAGGAGAAAAVACASLKLDAEAQRVTFDFDQVLAVGSYELSVHYLGELNDKLAGFYRSSYKAADGSTRHMAVTQFEATDCRRAVPCVDEPAVKATFDVTLIVAPALQAVSNMPVLEKTTTKQSSLDSLDVSRGLEYPAGLARYKYYRSPIMSTYLLAFVVGEFDYISRMSRDGTEVRVYTGVGKTHLGEFSLATAVAALDFYNSYFGIPYPLPKMDLLAIPDFAAGAMENWGCITYRETALLIDPVNSSAAVMQRVARTVCHEIAHMWFGNLVTMEWWSYLWLNEGFARFMEHLAVDAIYPNLLIWESFVAEVFAQAQALDALESSHPVEVTVNHPSEVNEIFDTISYAKGASLIRMLNAAIGDKAFREGLQAYLKKFSYQNTQTADLWAAFSEASGQDVGKMMQAWVEKIGYPVLSVRESKSGEKHMCMCQERFLASYDPKGPVDLHATTWTIPVAVASWKKADLAKAEPASTGAGALAQSSSSSATAEDKKHRVPHEGIGEPHIMKVLFDKAEGEYPAAGLADDSVLKVNPGQTGFYRVAYSDAMFATLSSSLASLPAVERLGVLRDTFALGSSGRTSIKQSLDLVQSFKRETNYAVVSALAGNLSLLASLHHDKPYHSKIQSLVREVFAFNFQRLGWAPAAAAGSGAVKEDQLLVLFRALVIGMMSNVGGDPTVQAEALARFRAFVTDPLASPIPADLRGSVYTTAAKKGTEDDYAALMQLYKTSELQEEKNRVLSVLGMVEGSANASAEVQAKESARIAAALEMLLDQEAVRTSNVAYLMSGIGASALGRKMSWAWFQANFATIQSRTVGQNFIISGLLNAMLGGNTSVEFVKEFEAFFAKNPIPQATRTLNQLSEAITLKAARLARETADVEAWLNEKQ